MDAKGRYLTLTPTYAEKVNILSFGSHIQSHPAVDARHLHRELEGHAGPGRHHVLRQARLNVGFTKSSISHFEIFIPRRLYEDSLIRFLFSIKTPLKSTRYSSRINFAVDCPMDFHKFPFDKQVVIAKEIMTRMTMMMLLQVCQVKMTSFSQPAKVPSLS